MPENVLDLAKSVITKYWGTIDDQNVDPNQELQFEKLKI